MGCRCLLNFGNIYLLNRVSRIRNLVTRIFVHLITCLRRCWCTSHFLHLKKLFVKDYKDKNILEYKLNLRPILLATNPEPEYTGYTDCFYREKTIKNESPM